MVPRRVWTFVLCLALASGCTAPAARTDAPIHARTVAELRQQLLSREPDVEVFRTRGPFEVLVHNDRTLHLSSTERVPVDLFLTSPPDNAPLVLLLHGYDSSKRAHSKQAEHLASWGMHAMTVQLSRRGPWARNGRMLARIARSIRDAPRSIDNRIDVERIILVGHSFGAYSVAVALAEGAPVAGAILLDPAATGREPLSYLRRVTKPVLIIGADDEVQSARNREEFFELVPREVAEVSIRDAGHEDAQYPSEFALQNSGHDPHTSEDMQIAFASALTAGVISLTVSSELEYAWKSFGRALQDGRFFDGKRK